jgi:radical SAM superfamily enzyme YgiQ (UPF0313 family)
MITCAASSDCNSMHVFEGDEDYGAAIDGFLSDLFPHRKIRRILLVAPPDAAADMFDDATCRRGRYGNFPPYGLGIIARYLLADGVEVRIVNLNNEVLKACRCSHGQGAFDFDNVWHDALRREIGNYKPDFAGVTCMFTQSHTITARVCEKIKELSPRMPLALGGVHVSNCFHSRKQCGELLNDFACIDLFFLYEAEVAFRHFVRAVNKTIVAHSLYQVFFNKYNCCFPVKKIPAGDELDVAPAYELMAMDELSRYGLIGSFYCFKSKSTQFATVLSNRGCRGRCTYCSVHNFNGGGVRHRSVQAIVDELLVLKDRFGIGHVMWLDDDLFFNHKRAVLLFNEMVKRNTGMTWDCTNGVIAASCTEELIAAAAESGCIGLNIGVESGNPKILTMIKKPGTIREFLRAADVLKKFDQINTRVFLMIGFPGETGAMILDTFHLALAMDLDWYNITILQPLPNTPIFDTMVSQGLVEPVNATQVRYNSGPYGKRRENLQKNLPVAAKSSPFSAAAMDRVPARTELEDIWLTMNFHLNFKRLMDISNPVKLEQQMKYVRNIVEMVAPDDPFPLYFYGCLQQKIKGTIDKGIIDRLELRLHTSEYWRKSFARFDLSPTDLQTRRFPVAKGCSDTTINKARR